MQIWFCLQNNANPNLNPKITHEEGHQILSFESFIHISISLVSKAKRVKLSHRGNCPLEQILFGQHMANFLAQLIDGMAEFSGYFSKTTDNTKK